MTIAIPINRPIKQRVLTADASSTLSVKNERMIPMIPVIKMRMTPHPKAAFVALKEAFFNGILKYDLDSKNYRQPIQRLFFQGLTFMT